jgi:hypothetical protein
VLTALSATLRHTRSDHRLGAERRS